MAPPVLTTAVLTTAATAAAPRECCPSSKLRWERCTRLTTHQVFRLTPRVESARFQLVESKTSFKPLVSNVVNLRAPLHFGQGGHVEPPLQRADPPGENCSRHCRAVGEQEDTARWVGVAGCMRLLGPAIL